MKKRLAPTIAFVIVAALVFSIIELIGYGFDILQFKFNLPISNNGVVVTSKLPANDSPPGPQKNEIPFDLQKLVLNPEPYNVSPNVLSDVQSYQKFSTHLLLNGDFSQAQLVIKGDVLDSGRHFLYLNYGNVAGVINGVRYSANALNVTQTVQNGGVFTSANSINLRLDLFGTTQLATTRSEYNANHQTMKLVNLWQLNTLPPTYINLVVVPFNEYGVFGGAKLQTEFDYQCTPGSKCEAIACPAQNHVYDCMRDKFGQDAASKWCRNVDCDHSSLKSHKE